MPSTAKRMVKTLVGEGSRVHPHHLLPVAVRLHRRGRAALRLRSGQGEGAAGRSRLPERLRHPDSSPIASATRPRRMIGYLQAVGIRANLTLPAVRRHARADPRQQGGADAPDLGLVLGQRRLGRDAELLRLRGRRHHPRPGSARPPRQGRTTRSIRQVRKEAYAKALTLIAEQAYAVPLYSLPVYLRRRPRTSIFKAYPDEMPRFWEMTWK